MAVQLIGGGGGDVPFNRTFFNVTLADLTFLRRDNGSITAAPIFTNRVDLAYFSGATGSTGPELPTSSTAIHILETNWANLTLTTSATVNLQLLLDSGVVTTGSNVLIVAAGATVSRTTGYIDGNEARTFNSVGTLIYDIGAGGSYSPVAVNALALSLPQAILTIKAVNSSIGGLVSLQSLQRNWVFSSSPITKATLTFNYAGGDVPGGANTAQWVVVRKLANDQRFTFPNGFTDNVTEGGMTATATAVTMPAFGGTYGVTQTDAPGFNPGDPRPVELTDFDGNDARTDVAAWDGASGDWAIINSTTSIERVFNWGRTSLGDQVAPGDYDGDGRTDIAVWRNADGNWYIIRSSDNAGLTLNWGGFGDMIAPGDYDGDGKTDIAVFRPSEGNWYIKRSSDGVVQQANWGTTSDLLVPADYDGDGKTDVAVWRPSEGNWYVIKSSGGTTFQNWGQAGDKVVAGDYDGDGKADYGIFRPSEGNWYIINSSDNSGTARNWGAPSDIPVPGDYDRDGKTDFAVYRPSEGNWYIINSSTGAVTVQYRESAFPLASFSVRP